MSDRASQPPDDFDIDRNRGSSVSGSSLAHRIDRAETDVSQFNQLRINSHGEIVEAGGGGQEPGSGAHLPDAIIGLVDKTKKWSDLVLTERLFLLSTVVTVLFCIVISVMRIINLVVEGSTGQPQFLVTWVLLVNAVAIGYFNIYAVFMDKIFELYVGISVMSLFVVYVTVNFVVFAINFEFFPNDINAKVYERIIRALGTWILGPLNIVLAILVIRLPKLLVGETVGAKIELQKAYRNILLFTSLTKFDTLTMVSFAIIQFSSPGSPLEPLDVVGLSLIPVLVVWELAGWVGVRAESRVAVLVFLLLSLLAPVFVVYEVVNTLCCYYFPHPWLSVRIMVCGVGGMALLLRLLVLLMLFQCWRGFGSGIKQRYPIFTNASPYNPIARLFAAETIHRSPPSPESAERTSTVNANYSDYVESVTK